MCESEVHFVTRRGRSNMVQLRNVVCKTQFKCHIDLKHLANVSRDVYFDPTRQNSLMWKHKQIGGYCMVSNNGKLMCNGGTNSIAKAKKRVRRYARLIQKAGYPVHMDTIRVITMSAIHTLTKPLDLIQITKILYGQYEPEIFPAAMFKQGGIHFNCFRSGKVVMTGIKRTAQIRNTIIPCIIELQIL